MSLNIDDVRKIALLARLRLEPGEEELFTAQLGEVVDYIDQLAAYETAEADPAAEAAGLEAADEPRPGLDLASFLANAPASKGQLLEVPRVKALRSEGRGP